MTHTLFICTTCAATWKDGKRVGTSGGEQLLEELQKLHQSWTLQESFPIKPVECMSACSHACAIAFAAEGKYAYLFGDLPVTPDTLPATASAILACASTYSSRTDGMLAWAERPEPLKRGVIARIPPMTQLVAS
jgi:predicted metal-binding protein